MGTFHHNHGELHGITVVVETRSGRIYVGRCHERNEVGVLLLDLDWHDDGGSDIDRQTYLGRARERGIWKRQDRQLIPAGEVLSVRRLGEL